MTTKKCNGLGISLEELMAGDADFMTALMKQAPQEVLESEMTEQLGAGSNRRSESRSGYRAGYYTCARLTLVAGTSQLLALFAQSD